MKSVLSYDWFPLGDCFIQPVVDLKFEIISVRGNAKTDVDLILEGSVIVLDISIPFMVTLARLVPTSIVPRRSSPDRFAPERLAPDRLALVKLESLIRALRRSP